MQREHNKTCDGSGVGDDRGLAIICASLKRNRSRVAKGETLADLGNWNRMRDSNEESRKAVGGRFCSIECKLHDARRFVDESLTLLFLSLSFSSTLVVVRGQASLKISLQSTHSGGGFLRVNYR